MAGSDDVDLYGWVLKKADPPGEVRDLSGLGPELRELAALVDSWLARGKTPGEIAGLLRGEAQHVLIVAHHA